MSHIRQQIRESAIALLSGNTDAQTYVYSSLFYPIDEDDLPVIVLRTDQESSDLLNIAGPLTRELSLVITAYVTAEEQDLQNSLDTIAAQIESLIGNQSFSGLAKWVTLSSTDIQRVPDASKPTGSVALTFTVIYHSSTADGETAL